MATHVICRAWQIITNIAGSSCSSSCFSHILILEVRAKYFCPMSSLDTTARGYENTAVINLITPRFADTGCSIIGNTNHYKDSRQSDLDSFCERCSWVNTRAGASAAMAARLLLQSYSCCGGMIDRCGDQSEDSPRHRDAAASHSRELFLELCRFPSSHASSSNHEATKYVLKVLVWSIRISTINICIMLASQIPERGRVSGGCPAITIISPPARPGAGERRYKSFLFSRWIPTFWIRMISWKVDCVPQ